MKLEKDRCESKSEILLVAKALTSESRRAKESSSQTLCKFFIFCNRKATPLMKLWFDYLQCGRTKLAIHVLFTKYLRLPDVFDEIPEEIDKHNCLVRRGNFDLKKLTLQNKKYNKIVKHPSVKAVCYAKISFLFSTEFVTWS